jgi:hypothetical protein
MMSQFFRDGCGMQGWLRQSMLLRICQSCTPHPLWILLLTQKPKHHGESQRLQQSLHRHSTGYGIVFRGKIAGCMCYVDWMSAVVESTHVLSCGPDMRI